MAFEIGQTVGPYRITEQLGQGGMATVYKAYHASLDRYVAIKVLHAAFQDDETFNLRFQREAQIVARLEHQHIVPIYDFETGRGEPYIVMKFIEGQTLKHRTKEKALNLQETLEMFSSISAALTYAHNRGVLHRDIKPSNVMLDKEAVPYLTDFGLARIVTSGESTMSQDVLIGTPNYISPEQARGEKNLEPTTDVYSLGIMLYEIVVGRVPFSADTPFAVVHDHIYKPLPLPTVVNPSVTPQVENVLLKALSKEPKDRYPSAIELANAFKEAVTVSHMSELSAASVRLERFADSAPTTLTATNAQDINTAIRAAIAEALPQQLSKINTPAVPPVTGSWPQQGSSIQQRRNLGRGFWILFGVAVLAFVCIGSLTVVINAFNDPIVQKMPVAEAEDVIGTAIPEYKLISPDISLAEAETLVNEQPDNPMARMILALRYRELGRLAEAEEQVRLAVENPNVPAEVFAQSAETVAQMGFVQDTILLWALAYERDPANTAIRNAAGQYIYRNLNEQQLEELTISQYLFRDYPETSFTKTLSAQMLLSSTPTEDGDSLTRAKTLLDESLALDDSLAETHLVYGNYYAAIGDLGNAERSWRFANSFSDTPNWVQVEVNNQRSRYEMTSETETAP